MNLILLTVKSRNGKALNEQMLIDVDDIATPLKKTGALGGDTTFSLREGKKGPFAHFNTGTALTTYIVDETLAQINAMVNEIFVANVVSYHGRTQASTPEMGFNMKFVAGRIGRDTVNNVSYFKYQEDSDPDLVDYTVTQTLAQIVAQLNTQFVESVTGPNVDNTDPWNPIVNDGSIPTPILWADFITAYNGNTLTQGKYIITDRADHGIVVSTFLDKEGHMSVSKSADGVFLNPDFQFVGDYSGVAAYTGVALGVTTNGVWVASDEATYTLGDIVFWNGFHYQLVDLGALAGTNPFVNAAAYTFLPKDTVIDATTFGYIEETDEIGYDVFSDLILYRRDKRRNFVQNNIMPVVGAEFSFQWGNDSVYQNELASTVASCNIANQRGVFYGNTIHRGQVTIYNTQQGEIHSNSIYVAQLYLVGNGDFFNNTIDYPGVFNVDMNEYTYSFKMKDGVDSTFFQYVDMDTQFSAGTLTLSGDAYSELCGRFFMINNTGQVITKIIGMPTSHDCEFTVQNGNTQSFSHTAIGASALYDLVSDAAAVNTITGRATASDFIRYRRMGTSRNVRTNLVVLA